MRRGPPIFHPLSRAAIADQTAPPVIEDYPFVQVEGEGVHEIPVGPVHAGIIEPGHFRFSIVGEKVSRLEQHLGYVHKGIERRLPNCPCSKATGWPRGCPAIRRLAFCGRCVRSGRTSSPAERRPAVPVVCFGSNETTRFCPKKSAIFRRIRKLWPS